MQKTDKIYCYLQSTASDPERLKQQASDCLTLGRLVFDPVLIELDDECVPFSVAQQQALLENLPAENFTLRIRDEWSESVFQQHHDVLFERHYFTREQFISKRSIILDYLNIQMKHAQFAYIRSYDEFLYHNIERLDYRQMIESPEIIEQHPKKKNKFGEIILDGHYFPGYDIFHLGFCFTSCWRMYFGELYRSVLPLNLIREVQQVERVVEMYDNTLMVELYKDPYRWDEPSNLHFQRLFRDQLGIDQLTWLNGIGVLREPFVEYRSAFHSLQIIQYQNDFLQPVPKSQATHFVTRMYNLDTSEETVTQVKGSLNAQAYFPMINDRQRKMKTVVTLMVGQTVDEGLSAYEFYIRNYLEINLADKRYDTYTPILTFFLPDKHFAQIPIRQLKAQMMDVSFNEERVEQGHRELRLSKGNKRLQVEFFPLSFLYLEKKGRS